MGSKAFVTWDWFLVALCAVAFGLLIYAGVLNYVDADTRHHDSSVQHGE